MFYLEASEEEIWKRIGADTNRPLLQCEQPMERIKELLAARRPIYEAAARYRIPTGGREIDEIAKEIYHDRTERNGI